MRTKAQMKGCAGTAVGVLGVIVAFFVFAMLVASGVIK